MIVDDHTLLAEALAKTVNEHPEMEVVALAANGKEALKKLENADLNLDLILMDLCMDETDSPEPDGILTARTMLKDHFIKGIREFKIIVISQLAEGYFIDLAHKIGVRGYLPKDCESKELFEAITSVVRQNRRYYRGAIEAAMDQFSYEQQGQWEIPDLTPTEREILLLIADGLTTKEIAEKRGRGEDGIEAHRKNMMRKFRAKNAPHMITLACHMGLV